MGNHTTFEIVRKQGAYFVQKDGEVVHGPACLARAEDALEKLERKARQRTRKCLTCSTSFLSDGPHNRMCNYCRHQSLYCGAV